MRLSFCAACGSKDDLQHHHLVTRGEGRKPRDDERNLITLCCDCHLKLHERRRNGVYNHRERTIAGLQAAKARGVKLGGPIQPPPTPEQRAKGSKATADRARAFAARLAPILSELSALSANSAAQELARRGVSTANGGVWSAGKVITIRKRMEA